MSARAGKNTPASAYRFRVACASLLPMAAPAGAETEMQKYQAAERLAAEHIAKYRTADFDVFTNQQWDRVKESHATNVVVHWPDGHQTKGLDAHIDDLKALFVFAPDTSIRQHPVELATGDWSSVIGVMEGTSTQPMPTPDAKAILPTGKSFKVTFPPSPTGATA